MCILVYEYTYVCIYIFSSGGPQPEPRNRFQRMMAQTMRFGPKKCLLGVTMITIYLLGVGSPKNRPNVGVSGEIPTKT